MNTRPYVASSKFSTVLHLRWPAAIFLLALVMSLISSLTAAAPLAVAPGYSSELIQVKFREGTDVDPPEEALPLTLRNSVAKITRLFSLSKGQLDEIRARGQSRSGEALPDLNLWFEITLKSGTDATAFLNSLKQLPSVETAQLAPLPLPPSAVTPDFTGLQGYLGPATDGIDAQFSSTLPGGNGNGVTIYDVEYNWLQSHEDLTKASGVSLLLNSGDTNAPPGFDLNGDGIIDCAAPCDSMNREHGTAVLGELIADNDTKGVTGISWGANIGLAPANTTNLGYNIANAILLAVADGEPGDVILIEQQAMVCGLPNFGPAEVVDSVFNAIQTATANRFVVVEAGGNGGVDLDQAACGTTFDRTVRDSGAIIVGAGGSPGSGSDRERLAFSSFGSRVDLQGWGDSVVTTGYGDHYTNADATTDANFWYTDTFSGTSSASPIVAGAVANLQGVALNKFGTPLLPFQVRQLLVETGSAQLGNTAEHIGPRPDLGEAITTISEGPIDIYFLVDLSDSFSDDLPVFHAQAPGIIDTLVGSNPDIRFGLGSFEDYPISPFGLAPSDAAYRRNIDLTFDKAGVKAVIGGLSIPGPAGADVPESQLPALFQAATGAGQDLSGAGFPGASIPAGQQANFRDGATKLFLLWTDAAFHLPNDPGDIPYPGPTFNETVAAILALDPPRVIGISSGGGGLSDLQAMATATGALAPADGVDCDADGDIDISAGQPLVCPIASSGEGIGEAIMATVEAITNKPPVANAGPDQSVECTSDAGAVVILDGTGSSDPHFDPLTFSWSAPGITFDNPSGPKLTASFPFGTTTVTLTVTDPGGLSDTDTVNVTVKDTTAPSLTVTATPSSMLPDPQHKYQPITLTVTASDVCDPSPTITAVVQSSEPDDARGTGDGNTTGDIKVTKANGEVLLSSNAFPQVPFDPVKDKLEVRTERNGSGPGRTYTITVTATDDSGNKTVKTATVVVLHDVR